MAKAKRNAFSESELETLEALEADPEVIAPTEIVVPEVALPSATDPEITITQTVVEVPLASLRMGAYSSRKIDARLSQRQARTLKRMRDALHEQHAKLGNGRHVDSNGQAVQWLLEQIETEV